MQAHAARSADSTPFALTSTAIKHAAVAGVIAGIVMAMFAMIIALIAGNGFWAPPRAIAAEFLGTQHAGPGFAIGPVLAGMIIHMMLSAAFGAGFSVAVGVVARGASQFALAVLGMVTGIVLWVGSTYIVAPALNGAELFTTAMPAWTWFAAHVMFGVALGVIYGRLRRPA